MNENVVDQHFHLLRNARTQPCLHPTNTHANKKDSVCLMTSAHLHLQPTQTFFQFPSRRMHKFSYRTTAQKSKKIQKS